MYLILRRLLLATSLVSPAFCQSPPDTNPTGSPEQPLLDYSLTFDAYSETKLGNLTSTNLLRNFDLSSDRFELAATTLTVQITKGPLGFHFDSGYGQMYQAMTFSDPWHGVNRYFGQYYASIRPFKSSDFDLDFGKFYTSVGAEVPDTASNFQYSRSLLFTLGSPYYHFGLRASKSLSKDLVVGAQLINGWNDVVNNTGGETAAITATYTKKLFNVTETYLVGPEPIFLTAVSQPLAARPKKTSQLSDTVVKLTPSSHLNGYLEGLYGEEKNLTFRDSWWGIAGAVTVPLSARWSISPRWEFYNDATGATSGYAQKLQEVTATLQYQPKLVKNMLMRAELRNDFSNQPFFLSGPNKSKNQPTALLAVVYTYKGSKN